MQSVDKKIGKNAFSLYIRMIVMLIISLYTSRIILEKLGAEDYGIYNLIGGVVALFTLLRGAFSNATQRFLNIAIGKNLVTEIKDVFNISSFIYFVIGLIFVLLIESVGVWFFFNKLMIPINRVNAAFIVFQISAFSIFLSILTVPYDAIVIAYQKMSFYALISIAESVFRLIVLYLIFLFPVDKLITYAFLLLLGNIIIRITYILYSRRVVAECRYSFHFERSLIKEISTFAGWNFLGTFTFSIVNQGINLVLNIFGGVLLNAAQGIANQVNNAIMNLLNNIILAFNPHLIELHAQGKIKEFYDKILFATKCNILMFLLLVLPIYLFIHQILHLWLKEVPEYSSVFVRSLLFYSLMRAFHNPVGIIFISSGKLKMYQLIESIILFFTLPLSYILLSFKFPFYTVFIVMGGVEMLNLAVITLYAHYTHHFPIKKWSKTIFFPTIFLFVSIIIIDNFLHLIYYKIVLLFVAYTILINLFVSKHERVELKKILCSKMNKR